jgi:hypothetical protein
MAEHKVLVNVSRRAQLNSASVFPFDQMHSVHRAMATLLTRLGLGISRASLMCLVLRHPKL